MVGVAGKSKGCNTCRMRKIRCDLKRPECGQCLKSSRTCLGYRRETVFLNQSSRNNLVINAERSRPTMTKATPQPRADLIQDPQLSARIDDRHASHELFIGKLMHLYLPSSESAGKVPLSWLQLVVDLAAPGEALYCALSALSLAIVGRCTKNSRLPMESLEKYGQALRELQRALWDEDWMYRDETLAASMVLCLYEVYECPSNTVHGWISHSEGTARLVQLRGPRMYASRLGHELYKEFRGTCMVHNITTRKSTFINEPQWSTIPWEGRSKTIDQKLYDLGAELSSILKSSDMIESMQDPQEVFAARLSVRNKCGKLDQSLELWYEELQHEIPAPQYWPELSTIDNPADDQEHGKVFPVCFKFSSLRNAKVLMNYWALSIMLHSTDLLTYRALQEQSKREVPRLEHPPDDWCHSCVSGRVCRHCGSEANKVSHDMSCLPPLTWKHDHRYFQILADNIAQSMEYCLSRDMGTLGGQWVLFPLRVAIQSYSHSPCRKLSWAKVIHEKIPVEKGIRLFSRDPDGQQRLDYYKAVKWKGRVWFD